MSVNNNVDNFKVFVTALSYKKGSETTLVTMDDENVTATVAQILNGYFYPAENLTAGRTLVTPDADDIVAGIQNCKVGTTFNFAVNNVQGNASTRTLTAGTGITINATVTPDAVVAQNEIIQFAGVVTNISEGTEAITIVQLTKL